MAAPRISINKEDGPQTSGFLNIPSVGVSSGFFNIPSIGVSSGFFNIPSIGVNSGFFNILSIGSYCSSGFFNISSIGVSSVSSFNASQYVLCCRLAALLLINLSLIRRLHNLESIAYSRYEWTTSLKWVPQSFFLFILCAVSVEV